MQRTRKYHLSVVWTIREGTSTGQEGTCGEAAGSSKATGNKGGTAEPRPGAAVVAVRNRCGIQGAGGGALVSSEPWAAQAATAAAAAACEVGSQSHCPGVLHLLTVACGMTTLSYQYTCCRWQPLVPLMHGACITFCVRSRDHMFQFAGYMGIGYRVVPVCRCI